LVYQLNPLGVSNTESMKNIYSSTVFTYGKNKKGPNAKAFMAQKAGVVRLRVLLPVILIITFIFIGLALNAQNCPTTGTTTVSVNENTYYPATQATVAVGATSITLGPIGSGANFGSTPIASGDIVLIIQMQGAQLNLPASNTSAFYGANLSGLGAGMITTNLLAGTMEFAVANNAVPVGGGTLNLLSGTAYAYSNAPYSAATGQYTYQVIRVSTHFNIQLGANITTPIWNGSTGGVTIISAVNQIDFNGKTVSALGAGFRGGGGRQLHGQAGVTKNDFYDPATTTAQASKGEGIAGTPRYLYYNNVLVDNVAEGYPGGSYARGAPANAGGGASDSDPASNDQNAGGGGGGNGGAGGLGGNGWFSFGFTGGRGGTAFQTYAPITTYYSPSRLIMGGGGGAGSTNDGTGTPGSGVASGGATGGGMVIINSSTIIGTGTINANGVTGNSTVIIDGSGGGGAGGSILIYANSGQAGITATAKGGNGGSNNPNSVGATQHGPGGGGGGGVIFSNAALNVASTVAQGVAGISTGTSGTDNFGAGDGFVGVLTQTFPAAQLPPNMQICQSIVLPVTLLNFSASYVSANNVKVSWTTTDEINASYYVVERSSNDADFIPVAQVDANNSTDPIHVYDVNDQLYNINSNIVYYRLRIVDNNGIYTHSKVVPVKLDQPDNIFSVYPNPVDNYVILNLSSDKPGSGMLRMIDNSGRQILTKSFNITNGNNSIMVDQLGNIPKGIYFIQVMVNGNLYNQKIIKK
jgi:Secretion system C-terminal sorting domain